jgi:predicted CXXCH cytochrome family protein
MDKRKKRKLTFAAAGILMAGSIAYLAADDKREIPDHSGFQSCRPCHAGKHEMWEESNHGEAIGRIVNYDQAAGDCAGCHSIEIPGNEAQRAAPESVEAEKNRFHKISCLACHDPNHGEYRHRLVRDPEKLCEYCHSQRDVFLGLGAKGIQDSRNFHSGVPCVSCHMNEGNHRMKVIRPDDPGLSEKRLDTCTACHMDDNREARVRQIQEWQGMYLEGMEPLNSDVNSISAALEADPDILDAGLRSKFDDVKANLSILEKDGSRGFHNFVFSLEIMSQAAPDLKEIKAAIE